MSAPRSIHLFHSSSVLRRSPTSFPIMPSYSDAAMSLLMMKSNFCATSESAAEPPIILHPLSFGKRASSSFMDIGMLRRYLPGTVLPLSTTVTAASGISAPSRIMSMVTYSTRSAPASMAAPAMARIMGEMYGGTPSAAGSSM